LRKRLFALAASALMFLSACNIVNVTEAATINGKPVLKNQYLFYLDQGKMSAFSMAQQNGDSIAADEDWNTVMIEGVTAGEYAKNLAKRFLKESVVMREKALELGITLTAEDEATVTNYKTQIVDQYGGRFEYQQHFDRMGLTDSDVTTLAKDTIYGNKIWQKYYEEDESFQNVSDEEVLKAYNDEYAMAKHILILNQPEAVTDEVEEKTPEEMDAEAREKAQGILDRLLVGENFDALMNEFSEDPGLLESPDGYLFTKGQMVPQFEEAAFALQAGEMTNELVQTDYGYHIILRLENPTEGEEFEAARDAISGTVLSGKFEGLVEQWGNELNFVFNDAVIDKIKVTTQ